MILAGVLKLVGAGLEFFLGIPGLGGGFILALYWTPLLFMLVFHIVTLVFSKNEGLPIWGPVLGIIASTLGFIPVLGMMLHWAAFICLLVDGIQTLKRKNDTTNNAVA
ncbi:hypothetical protein [Alkalibacillus haloalkaliphilus]|uniref:hypothetical protein n=1 Tax=Alkalibacillus haloalkaliphilus TaxID=94136 RepID=UPI0002ED98FC|nr:hypothetical protein [Alkalibacillus haloalkaliphilus]